jgi:hypothetical protein
VREFAKIVLVQLVILLCGLAAGELMLELFAPMPVPGGEYHDRAGKAVHVALDRDTLRPNLDVIHSAPEFSASVHTDERGYRKMSRESTTPEFLFLGDSFTFGHGVSDDEVASEIFCRARATACLNLGRSGTDTFDQLRILRHAIEAQQIRPKTVVVIMLAACWLRSAGNDLGDNLTDYRNGARGELDAGQRMNAARRALSAATVLRADAFPTAADVAKTLQGWLARFEITKRLMLLLAGGLRSGIYSCSDKSELDAAAEATRVALDGLVRLSDDHGFKLRLVLVHPYQELTGTFRTTEAVVAQALPKAIACFGTAARFRKDDYYLYDGHFNARGQAKLASILDRALKADASEQRQPGICDSVP